MPALLVVRHARAGKRQDWDGDDRRRPLSTRGRAQADALGPVVARLLASEPRTARLLSSPWLRCTQTLTPASIGLGSPVTEVPELGEGMGEQAVAYLTGMARANTVCCTHGDVIGEVLARMRRDGLDLGPDPKWPKGSIWVFQARHGRFRAARFVAPPAGQ